MRFCHLPQIPIWSEFGKTQNRRMAKDWPEQSMKRGHLDDAAGAVCISRQEKGVESLPSCLKVATRTAIGRIALQKKDFALKESEETLKNRRQTWDFSYWVIIRSHGCKLSVSRITFLRLCPVQMCTDTGINHSIMGIDKTVILQWANTKGKPLRLSSGNNRALGFICDLLNL